MKKFNITLILGLLSQFIHAQNQANNWYFGNHAGITFNTNPPTMLSGGQINTQEGCSSISDNNGNLLFYTDGETVWNSIHSLMPNGTGLFGTYTTTQTLILQAPGSTTTYYIITPPTSGAGYLLPVGYSIVDMTMNSGLGAVTVKNTFLTNTCTEKVTAVYHKNGTDIWIIAHGYQNNNFYSFLLTSNGIDTIPVISSSGNPITTPPLSQGYLKASPVGNKIAMADNNNPLLTSTLELFDFDDSTGVVSNALLLGQWTSLQGVYGVEFSPDNSKVYTSILQPPLILQYDLLAGSPNAIIASMDTVGIATQYLCAMQTGPDGRIYISKYGSDSLACITSPNQQGNLCGFIENYISLGTGSCYIGLPNYLTSIFHNLSSGITSIISPETITVYPNPFIKEINVSLKNENLNNMVIEIKNILGQVIFNKTINLTDSYTKSINLGELPKGIYFLDVITDGERTVKKIVKE